MRHEETWKKWIDRIMKTIFWVVSIFGFLYFTFIVFASTDLLKQLDAKQVRDTKSLNWTGFITLLIINGFVWPYYIRKAFIKFHNKKHSVIEKRQSKKTMKYKRR